VPTPILTSTQSPLVQQKPLSTLIKKSNLSSFIQAGCKCHFQLPTGEKERSKLTIEQNLTPSIQLPLRPTRLVRPRREENPLPIHRSKPLRQTHFSTNSQPTWPRPYARVRRQTPLRKHRHLRIPRRRIPRPRPAPAAFGSV
jgi:hypothetical protein